MPNAKRACISHRASPAAADRCALAWRSPRDASAPPAARPVTAPRARTARGGDRSRLAVAFSLLMLPALLLPSLAAAHGFAGKRFFPVTMTFRDPISNEEFDTLFEHRSNIGQRRSAVDRNSLTVYYSKRITPTVALSVGTVYEKINAHVGPDQSGFRSLDIAGKFIGNIDPENEMVWSYGVNAILGGYGRVGINYNIYSPTVYFGKGFGNLTDWKSLRPFAITGAVAVDIPSNADVARKFVSDFSIQYNNAYAESFLHAAGVPEFLKHSIFLVELPFSTCLDLACRGDITGTVNPGFALVNFAGQLALEASIPVNGNTGNSIGVLLQAHLYLDNLFPDTLGKPIFQ